MITPQARGIYVVDVRGDAELAKYRDTKHCVCVAVGEGWYLFINTHQRKMYDDFILKASDYAFLKGIDRFLSCRHPRLYNSVKLIQKVGTLSDPDTRILIQKIQATRFIETTLKEKFLGELSKTLNTQGTP
jgi:hypothetical protein